ncbi:MAG: hypothetical protein Q7R47_02990 [Candidatus Diapherotrites archaeon]|nr:hypothetical protein [Candidatus Diapherotrites archaeon]
MTTDFLELRKKMLERTKKQVEHAFGEKEIHVIRASNALTDLEAVFNLLFEHCKEWYQYHFPELDSMVDDPSAYLKLVYEIGDKTKFDEKRITETGIDAERAKAISEKAAQSIGAQMNAETLTEIQLLSLNALNIKQEATALEKLLETELQHVAPNFTRLAGISIAGRMIAHTGSVEKLAMLPASAIQVLGAEKALFRFLKNRKSNLPPKHGYLFAHGLVRQLASDKRGRMARTLASKLSIAVRTDHYNPGSNVSDQLQSQLNRRLEELKASKTKNKPQRVFDNPRFQERYTARPAFQPPKPFRPNDPVRPAFQSPRPDRPNDSVRPAYERRQQQRVDSDRPPTTSRPQNHDSITTRFQPREKFQTNKRFESSDRPKPRYGSGSIDRPRKQFDSRDSPRSPRRFESNDRPRGRFPPSDRRPNTSRFGPEKNRFSDQPIPTKPRYTSLSVTKSEFKPDLNPTREKFSKDNHPRGKFSTKNAGFRDKKFKKRPNR